MTDFTLTTVFALTFHVKRTYGFASLAGALRSTAFVFTISSSSGLLRGPPFLPRPSAPGWAEDPLIGYVYFPQSALKKSNLHKTHLRPNVFPLVVIFLLFASLEPYLFCNVVFQKMFAYFSQLQTNKAYKVSPIN